MWNQIEIKRLAFQRGAGRTEWYSASAPCGGDYIIALSGDKWKVVFPLKSYESQCVDSMQEAADVCQKHLDNELSKFIEKSKVGGFATLAPPEPL